MVYNHKEYMREYNKRKKAELAAYWKTPQGKKSKKISEWKKSYKLKGNLEEIYEKYLTTEKCEICDVKLTEDKTMTSTRKCLDHCHKTSYYRWICCHSCNTRMGHVERKYDKVIQLIKHSYAS